ncbi:hypothetical protein L1987_13005 [Smallanthus sonchifolius]|uniref:Uncharacterized protein n=1 Tax=Smallanthus sonchifolius TaxID=185202 RepID=A0ACB9JFW7_9ASTR|nr:hypothetical protein L1987_13005 [Smallanthus sonchifolius]
MSSGDDGFDLWRLLLQLQLPQCSRELQRGSIVRLLGRIAIKVVDSMVSDENEAKGVFNYLKRYRIDSARLEPSRESDELVPGVSGFVSSDIDVCNRFRGVRSRFAVIVANLDQNMEV